MVSDSPIAICGLIVPDWTRVGEFRATGTPFRATDFEAPIAAVLKGSASRRCRVSSEMPIPDW
jgi:hypothetical protein